MGQVGEEGDREGQCKPTPCPKALLLASGPGQVDGPHGAGELHGVDLDRRAEEHGAGATEQQQARHGEGWCAQAKFLAKVNRSPDANRHEHCGYDGQGRVHRPTEDWLERRVQAVAEGDVGDVVVGRRSRLDKPDQKQPVGEDAVHGQAHKQCKR